MNPYYGAIAERANHRCEYCHAPKLIFNFPFEVKHTIPLIKQGEDSEANLALACRSCNLRKGTHTSGIDSDSRAEVRFFYPRQGQWNERFQVEMQSGAIAGLTLIGEILIEYL